MSEATIDKRNAITILVIFSLLLLPMLAVSPRGIDLKHFAAIAQEEEASSQSSSTSNQTGTVVVVVAQTPEEQANLYRFDRLDFEAWNNRNWTLFQELRSPDVLVVDFTGNTTRGIEQHLQWAMAAVSADPESRVLAHPIKIAAGDWTVVTGTLPGNLTMVTVAHWEDDRIAEEYTYF